MDTLATLIAAGKLRFVGVSNYPGWQLMTAQAAADRPGAPRFVAHQVYYSLIGRAYEADLLPLAADQGVGALVWSPPLGRASCRERVCQYVSHRAVDV